MKTVILKPTSLCNFNCKFCSVGTNKIDTLTNWNLKLDDVKDIIITGGEPFLTPISFFESLINQVEKIYEKNKRIINISITSNLSLFEDNFFCEKYKNILTKPFISVITSFQYGDGRTYKSLPFSEQKFIKCLLNFEKYFYYMPDFISLIDYSNEKDWHKHIELAKRLKIKCKLNNTLKLGKSNVYYPRWKMFRYYLDLIKREEDNIELTCINRTKGICDLNTSDKCWNNIICYSGNTCTGYCEHLIGINTSKYKDSILKDECLSCELCGLCNSCTSQKYQLITYGDLDIHCKKMKEIKDNLLESGFKL